MSEREAHHPALGRGYGDRGGSDRGLRPGPVYGSEVFSGDLVVPVDILGMLETRYGITMDALAKAYMKGAMDAIKEDDNA